MTDPAYYRERLYPLQDRVLQVTSSVDTGLYLTGGTAASRGYLDHRFSDDLDLFANDSNEFGLWSDRVADALSFDQQWQLTVIQREERFVRLQLDADGVALKIEIINDVPAHVGHLRDHPQLGRLDSPENILANKLTALVSREEPKDLADVWGFCCLNGMSIAEVLEGAHSKAAGLFAPDIARVLISTNEDDWRLIRWSESAPQAGAFIVDLGRLSEELLELPR